ncbi:MAG: hypothetical protein FWD55_04710 [Propionibacteriaceae bacterium]|nr:hypothetical protein [Propionibacteriaceae bacterium]
MQHRSASIHSFSIAPTPAPHSESRRVVIRLNQEWETQGGELASWMSPSPTLAEVLSSIRFNPDLVLSGLIHACQAGCVPAGRVIIQALLPKLILQSRSHPYPSIENLVSALWIRIAHYRLDHRPRSIAANLVLDTRKDVIAENRTALVLINESDDVEEPTAVAILGSAKRMGLASVESLTIVEEVYVEGLSSKKVAELHSMSTQAVRRRCSDTLRRLRTHRELLVEELQAA